MQGLCLTRGALDASSRMTPHQKVNAGADGKEGIFAKSALTLPYAVQFGMMATRNYCHALLLSHNVHVATCALAGGAGVLGGLTYVVCMRIPR